MPEAETMIKYTTLTIYVAPLIFSIPFWWQLLIPNVPALTNYNPNLTTWYITTVLAYLAAMWVVEIGWSAIDVVANGKEVKNITFGAIIFGILFAVTLAFAVFVWFGWYTFSNPSYNLLLLIIESLGLILFGWQARTILFESVRSNHIFSIAGNG